MHSGRGTQKSNAAMIVAIFFAVSNTVWASNDEAAMNLYWQKTGLTLEFTSHYFSHERCMMNETTFVACVQALDVLLDEHTPSEKIAPAAFAKSSSQEILRPALQTVGNLQIFAKRDLSGDLSTAERKKILRRNLNAYVDSLKLLYRDIAAKKKSAPDFQRLIRELKEPVMAQKGQSYEARLASKIINTFLRSSEDPHTQIVALKQADDDIQSADTRFVGIGVEIKIVNGQLVILNLLQDQPAINAGLHWQDVITSIDGESTANLSLAQASRRLRGSVGKKVTLEVLRKNRKLVFEMTRAEVVERNVKIETIQVTSELSFGYIRIGRFDGKDTCPMINDAVVDLEHNKNVRGFILDLRGNPGGDVLVASCVASIFLGDAPVFFERDQKLNKLNKVYKWPMQNLNIENYSQSTLDEVASWPMSTEPRSRLPMITLIDSASASAAEIVAGALRDYDRSWLAGDTSFGKATLQSLNRTPKDFASLKTVGLFETFARLFQPNGGTNQIVGIAPNFAIDIRPNAGEDDELKFREKDAFINALPAQGEKWVEPNQELVQSLAACAIELDPVRKYYADVDGAVEPDYRKLVATHLLICDLAQRSRATEPDSPIESASAHAVTQLDH
jgi:carboxyl-terminal processing protease